MRAHTGAILTTTTTNKAGRSMKATGTMKTTVTTTIGVTGRRSWVNGPGSNSLSGPGRKVVPRIGRFPTTPHSYAKSHSSRCDQTYQTRVESRVGSRL
jgi:hypothetical protein